MKKILLVTLASAAVGAGLFTATRAASAADSAATALADKFPRMRHLVDAVARRLDLTDAQRTAIRDVLRLHRPEMQPLFERARAERDEFRALAAAPTIDEAALAAQADKLAATGKELLIASAHTRADVRKILTADQLAKIDAWRQYAKGRAAGRRALFLEQFANP